MAAPSAGSGSDLDVGVEAQQRPLAVSGVDAQSQLHLLVEHHEDPNALLLQRLQLCQTGGPGATAGPPRRFMWPLWTPDGSIITTLQIKHHFIKSSYINQFLQVLWIFTQNQQTAKFFHKFSAKMIKNILKLTYKLHRQLIINIDQFIKFYQFVLEQNEVCISSRS